MLLRPGNAGSNTFADHLAVLTAAIRQIPARMRSKLLVRVDGAGASHELISHLLSLCTRCRTVSSAGTRPRSVTSMPCAAAQIQPVCRTGGHLGGVSFRRSAYAVVSPQASDGNLPTTYSKRINEVETLPSGDGNRICMTSIEAACTLGRKWASNRPLTPA